MPLHNIIPLCKFKYARDIYSSATFLYDTTGQISKDESIKPAIIDQVIEIEKVKGKLISSSTRKIDKGMVKRQLVAQPLEINIEHSRELYREMPDIEKSIEKDLEPPQRELNKNEVFELNTELREMSIELIKEVQRSDISKIDYTQNLKVLQMRDISGINKVSNINVDVDRIFKGDIDMIHDKNLGVDAPTVINKSESVGLSGEGMDDLYKRNINQYMDQVHNKELDKADNINYLDRVSEKEIIKDHTIKLYQRSTDRDISKNSQKYIDDVTIIDIDQDHSRKLFSREVIMAIDQYNSAVDLQRMAEGEMNKEISKKLFYRSITRDIIVIDTDYFMEPTAIIKMTKSDNTNYLDGINQMGIFKINNSHLDRIHTTNVFKIQEKYADRVYFKSVFKLDTKCLTDIQITPVYKEFQKPILNLSIEDIYKNDIKGLSSSTKEVHIPNDNKFIEITKRWWWLNDSSPKDRKIVPNRDYAKMKDLLSNPNYEYLRYTNHPIDWGKTWGIDHNIQPAAISIEIMLDLTNIITMIWHKSAHGWLRVTGKEGIQLLMELLCDWYSMSTSIPNHSYYRAYRWVRWEAEKVYFLNTTSGLQAIGILVKNLRDYLKLHHFNRVPIWRNPKAMDEERNFNRKAHNGDLMVDLNKTKGKRHYYIETQDFTKQNPILQSKK